MIVFRIQNALAVVLTSVLLLPGLLLLHIESNFVNMHTVCVKCKGKEEKKKRLQLKPKS